MRKGEGSKLKKLVNLHKVFNIKLHQNWMRYTGLVAGHRVTTSSSPMFSTLGLFQNLACPDKHSCTRPRCIFSHDREAAPPPPLFIPVQLEATTPSANATIPVKRPVALSPSRAAG